MINKKLEIRNVNDNNDSEGFVDVSVQIEEISEVISKVIVTVKNYVKNLIRFEN